MIQRYRFHISAWKEHFSHWPSVNETFFFQFLSSQWIGSPSQHLKLPPHCGFLIFSPPQIPCVDENWPCAMACLLPMWSDISVKTWFKGRCANKLTCALEWETNFPNSFNLPYIYKKKVLEIVSNWKIKNAASLDQSFVLLWGWFFFLTKLAIWKHFMINYFLEVLFGISGMLLLHSWS